MAGTFPVGGELPTYRRHAKPDAPIRTDTELKGLERIGNALVSYSETMQQIDLLKKKKSIDTGTRELEAKMYNDIVVPFTKDPDAYSEEDIANAMGKAQQDVANTLPEEHREEFLSLSLPSTTIATGKLIIKKHEKLVKDTQDSVIAEASDAETKEQVDIAIAKGKELKVE